MSGESERDIVGEIVPSPPEHPQRWGDWTKTGGVSVARSFYRSWFWIDDDVRNYAKDIEELKLPKERCIQGSAKGAEALGELREEWHRSSWSICPTNAIAR